MIEVFADAVFYIALLNPKDQYHPSALALAQNGHWKMITTAWVLAEVAGALSFPPLRVHTHQFLQKVQNDSQTFVVQDHFPWFAKGVDLFGRRADKEWSLVDCLSFEVMREREIHEALTADRHFAQAGFRLMLANPGS